MRNGISNLLIEQGAADVLSDSEVILTSKRSGQTGTVLFRGGVCV